MFCPSRRAKKWYHLMESEDNVKYGLLSKHHYGKNLKQVASITYTLEQKIFAAAYFKGF